MSDNVVKSSSITREREFALRPNAEERAALAEAMAIRAVRKLSFTGRLLPEGTSDLTLEASLGATVVQNCGVTDKPVVTRIDELVLRRYLKKIDDPDGDEDEMPEDDTVEPLTPEINLSAVMAEALALALPLWPRAEGVEPVNLSVTEPGKAPMTDEDARPFAGLAALRDQLKGDT